MNNKPHTLALAVMLLAAPLTLLAGDDYEAFKQRAKAEKRQRIQQLIEQRSPAIVTLKFVVTQSLRGRESKSEREMSGAMVSPDGLVLLANSKLKGPGAIRIVGLGGALSAPESETGDYRIIIGDEPKEYEARLVVRDSDRDLAWLQIVAPEGRTFAHVDFSDAVKLDVGDSYYSLARLGERFGRAPTVDGDTVSGSVTTPRPLLIAGGGTGPVFDSEAKVAGFVITQSSGQSGGPLSLSIGTTFILSAEEVAEATEQARKLAQK